MKYRKINKRQVLLSKFPFGMYSYCFTYKGVFLKGARKHREHNNLSIMTYMPEHLPDQLVFTSNGSLFMWEWYLLIRHGLEKQRYLWKKRFLPQVQFVVAGPLRQ